MHKRLLFTSNVPVYYLTKFHCVPSFAFYCDLRKAGMRLPLGLITLLVSAVSAWQGIGNPDNLITYDEQYVDGLTAYSGQKYADTITHFNRAMKDYNQLAEARLKCYAKCRRSPTEQPLEYSGDTELAFFNVILHRSACIEKCKEDFVGVCPISAAPYSIADLMERKEPYNYLQMAYYHVSIASFSVYCNKLCC